jgi:ketosteroid isomerase-like protein
MSERNMELYLNAMDTFNRRDFDAFLALTDEEIEIESRLVAIEGGYHGPEGVRRWWDSFLEFVPDYTLEVEALHDLGDELLGKAKALGHGAASGTPLVDVFWHPIRYRDGKIVWWRNCTTESEALEALGYSEGEPGGG